MTARVTTRRVALFGGSFNPPHVSHQLLCAYVLGTSAPAVDELWMIPTFKHPFDKVLVGYEERVEMCRLTAEIFGGRVVVSRIEEELGGESYTLNTVKALYARHPGVGFSLVIGADLVAERERWHGWPELSTLIDFIVVGRQGSGVDAAGLELPAVSSTDVRARLAEGRSTESLVPTAVRQYIDLHRLYRSVG